MFDEDAPQPRSQKGTVRSYPFSLEGPLMRHQERIGLRSRSVAF